MKSASDISKLPMWARSLIARLEIGQNQARAELAAFLDHQTPSRISFRLGIGDSCVFIPSDQVTLRLSDGWIDAKIYDGKLKLLGKDRLVIHPCSSNAIEVANRK